MVLTHIDGEYTATDTRCPPQSGPLGEGSIERGEGGESWLRCPWHCSDSNLGLADALRPQ